jgi:hypothetical protein
MMAEADQEISRGASPASAEGPAVTGQLEHGDPASKGEP